MPTANELNQPKWTGSPGAGHYEVWYLTLHDPESDTAFWMRYTLHDPPPGAGDSEAALWAFSFDPDGGGLELRDRYPIARFRSFPASAFRVELGPGHLDGHGAQGEVGQGAQRIAWDLKFDWARGSFRHVQPLLYRIRLASTSVSTPHMALSISGEIQVGERRYTVREARGEQGHVFGRCHADRWAWAHCAQLQGAEWAAFEGASAQVRKLGRLLPPATPLHVALEGESFSLNGARQIWTPQSEFELGRWTFEARSGRRMLRGEISAPPESFVSVEYADPTGGRAYCNHTERADTRLELLERRGGSWHRELLLESHGLTAFEIASRQRDPRPPRTLNLADARVCGGKG